MAAVASPSRSRSDAARRLLRPAARAARPAAASHEGRRRLRAGRRSARPRARRDTCRARRVRRAARAAARRAGATPVHRCPAVRCTRSRRAAGRPGHVARRRVAQTPRRPASRSAALCAPARCFDCAASQRTRRARDLGSQSTRPPARETRRPRQIRRDAWARLADRSSSAAISSSGPVVACAKCQTRRSGSSSAIGRVREREMNSSTLVHAGRRGTRTTAPEDAGSSPASRSRSSRPPRPQSAARDSMPERRRGLGALPTDHRPAPRPQ